MVRIAISSAAFEAIPSTLPLGSVGYEAQPDEKGQRLIWVEAAVLERLTAIAQARRELLRRDPAAHRTGGAG
jgi:hypothetical protein